MRLRRSSSVDSSFNEKMTLTSSLLPNAGPLISANDNNGIKHQSPGIIKCQFGGAIETAINGYHSHYHHFPQHYKPNIIENDCNYHYYYKSYCGRSMIDQTTQVRVILFLSNLFS